MRWCAVHSRWLRTLLLWLAFWGLRLPWLNQPLVGEEGLFAQIYSERPAGPDYGWMAHINGRDFYNLLEHPAFLYEAPRAVGGAAKAIGFPAPAEGEARVAWVRICNAMFQLLLWTLLGLAAPAGFGTTALLLALQACPLAVGSSLYLQTDTTTGVLLCGLLGLALAAGGRRRAFAAAFLLGLFSKQEWLICLVMALAASAVIERRDLRAWAGWAAGLVLCAGTGALLGRAFDPVNWDGGIDVLLRVGSKHNILVQTGAAANWASQLVQRSLWILPLIIVLIWLAVIAARSRRKGGPSVGPRLAVAWAWSLALPFLASTWGREYRYLAPAGAAAAAALLFAFPGRSGFSRRLALGSLIAMFAGALLTTWAGRGGRSITENPGLDRKAMVREMEKLLADRDCVPRVSTAAAWMAPGRNFVGSSMAPADADSCAAKAGMNVCP